MNCSSAQQAFRRLGVLLPVLGLLAALLSVPRTVRANSGSSILETIGVSIAVGTVLGASTLPFYDQPGKHAMNLAYGASAGAVTGLGILLYGLFTGPAQDGFDEASLWQKPGSEAYAQSRSRKLSARGWSQNVDLAAFRHTAPVTVYPALFWTPVVSLNW